jgi:hypothetical protein
MNNYAMNLFFGTLWLVLVTAVFSPETVGEWQARKAVAHDAIWGEYWMDCDCTEALE